MRTRGCVAAFAVVSALVLCEAAGAETFCVQDATCSGTSEPTIADAIAAAGGNGTGLDRVQVGPGLYAEGALVANVLNPVEIAGAGQGQTFVTRSGAASGDKVLDIQNATSTVSNLTVTIPAVANITGLALGPATAERVSVTGGPAATGATGINVSGGDVRQSVVALQTEVSGGSGIRALNGATVESSGVSGPYGISVGGPGVLLRGLRITGHIAMTMSNGGVDATETVENSAVTILPPNATGSLGLYARADSPDDSKLTVNLRHVTMRGKNGANTGIQAIANSSSNATEADVNVRDSVIADLTTDLFSSQANGDVAKISIDNSFYGFTKTSTSGGATITPGTQNLNSATVDPGFVDDRGDTHLRYDSPLIDRGVPGGLLSGESTTDLLGLPRLVDGDGDGTARRDIGALEYQRRPPVVQASAAPSSALPGAPFTFDGSATDPDPGDSVVSLGWSFDDGANAGGGTVQHAFAAPGAHSGTASATDSAGATGTATVGVSVVSASVVDATAPLLGIKGGRVRLSKRGVATITLTCPAAEVSGPCAGALVLDTVRKLRVKPAAKRRRVRLGRATFSVPSGSTRKVNVLLSKRNRLLVARLGLMKVAATADVHDQAGNTAKASRRLTLLPPTRKRS